MKVKHQSEPAEFVRRFVEPLPQRGRCPGAIYFRLLEVLYLPQLAVALGRELEPARPLGIYQRTRDAFQRFRIRLVRRHVFARAQPLKDDRKEPLQHSVFSEPHAKRFYLRRLNAAKH